MPLKRTSTPPPHRGFTLVELVVVVLILGILAGVAAPRFLDVSSDGQEAVARASVNIIADQIELQTARAGELPLLLRPEWFQGNRMPESPYALAGVPNLQTVRINGHQHPANKVISSTAQGAFWYNNATGAFRVLVPDQGSAAETLRLYNRVNYDRAETLSDTST